MKPDDIPPRRLRPESPSAGAGGPCAGPAAACVTSRELMGDARELRILHAGREYRLRVTQSGKLILTA